MRRFKDKVIGECMGEHNGGANQMWSKVTSVLGIAIGRAKNHEAWWWNKVIRDKVKPNRNASESFLQARMKRPNAQRSAK